MATGGLPYHRDNLEDALLDAAAEIIAESGVDALSLRGLGARAQVSRTAAYHYFADKSALLARLGERGFARLGERMVAVAGPISSARGRLHAGLAAYLAFAREEPHLFALMFARVLARPFARPLKGGDAQHPFSSDQAEGAFGALVETATSYLASRPKDRRDPLELANALWAYAHGIAILEAGNHLKGVAPETLLAQGVDALLSPPLPGPRGP